MALASKLEPIGGAGSFSPDDILTTEELAAKLKVKASWVREQSRHRGRVRNKHPMPIIRLGHYVRFRWSEISKWMLENRE